jgi:hypothetical protein
MTVEQLVEPVYFARKRKYPEKIHPSAALTTKDSTHGFPRSRRRAAAVGSRRLTSRAYTLYHRFLVTHKRPLTFATTLSKQKAISWLVWGCGPSSLTQHLRGQRQLSVISNNNGNRLCIHITLRTSQTSTEDWEMVLLPWFRVVTMQSYHSTPFT